MGKQSGDLTNVGSSIAILQERFKELQRVREKRKERELLKLFSESSSQDEAISPSYRPTLQDSLSLGLDLNGKHVDYHHQATKTPSLTNVSRLRLCSDYSDVDTSLHL